MKEVFSVFGLIVGLLMFAYVLGLFFEWREIRKLVSSGRSLNWNEAIERVLSGNGRFVYNRSSLPGCLWWIPSTPTDDFPDLYYEVKESGYIVISCGRREARKALKDARFKGKIYILDSDPFSLRTGKQS
jgi:hypothetical protein